MERTPQEMKSEMRRLFFALVEVAVGLLWGAFGVVIFGGALVGRILTGDWWNPFGFQSWQGIMFFAAWWLTLRMYAQRQEELISAHERGEL